MAKNPRFVRDKSGSRCRDTANGTYADCHSCRACPLKGRRKK